MLGCPAPGTADRAGVGPEFLQRLNAAAQALDDYLTGPRWYQRRRELGGRPLAGAPAAIAYFSPEFGITEVLPQYSGGLGILAGDHLKAASDLGVPLIGVGLLYRHGYFTQSLSADGWQGERYPASDPNGLPLELLRDVGGHAGADHRHPGRGPRAVRPGVAGPGGPGAAAAARLLRGGQRAGPARGHRPAVRRRHRAPAPPGAAARHRRHARRPGLLRHHRAPGARGVPHQRGPRRLPRPGAHPHLRRQRPQLRRGPGGVPGGHRVHHAHPGPGRASTGSPATSSSGTSARRPATRRCRWSACSRSAPRPTRAATRTSSTWP